jgi:hypothetical protein
MRRCQALMFTCSCRSVLPGYYWVPADGISAAAYKRDFGTLRWPIQAKTTTVIGMRKRAGAMSAYGTKQTSNCRPAMSAFGGKADIGRS